MQSDDSKDQRLESINHWRGKQDNGSEWERKTGKAKVLSNEI